MARSRRGRMYDPEGFCKLLGPARQACIEQMRNLEISGDEYATMQMITAALDEAALRLTGQRDFFYRRVGSNLGSASDA